MWGRIVFGHSNEQNRAVLAELRLYIIIISAVLLTIFIIIIVLINRKLTQPIQLLKNGLEKISYGNFSHRIEIRSNDEFSYLGNQFNEMAEKIESMMTEIEATHHDLEKQVTSRTRELNESNQKLQVAMQELRDTQQHIIQSEKQKSLTAIVSGFAHEINNPLTGILGYVDLISIREDTTPLHQGKTEQHPEAGRAHQEHHRPAQPAEPGHGTGQDGDQPVQPAGKTGQGRRQPPGQQRLRHRQEPFQRRHHHPGQPFRPVAGLRRHRGECHRSPARKQRPERQDRHRPEKIHGRPQAIVDISDNGGGFKNLDKAFDPFYTTKSRTQKKGIGLTIAYNIIQEHQGNIVIKNNDDQGATVSVYLKIAEKKIKNQTLAEEK